MIRTRFFNSNKIDFDYYEHLYKDVDTFEIILRMTYLEENHIFEWEDMLIMFQEILKRRNYNVDINIETIIKKKKINVIEEDVDVDWKQNYKDLSDDSDRIEEEIENKFSKKDEDIYLKDE